MSRLLTDDCYTDGLRKKVMPMWEFLTTYQQEFQRSICEAQDAETLKAVWKWLEGNCLIFYPFSHEPKCYRVEMAEANIFKCGEMPEEGV